MTDTGMAAYHYKKQYTVKTRTLETSFIKNLQPIFYQIDKNNFSLISKEVLN